MQETVRVQGEMIVVVIQDLDLLEDVDEIAVHTQGKEIGTDRAEIIEEDRLFVPEGIVVIVKIEVDHQSQDMIVTDHQSVTKEVSIINY